MSAAEDIRLQQDASPALMAVRSSALVRPYYADDNVTLYHGDCVELLPMLKADVAITDPPYNVGLDYSNGDKRTDYKEWCAAWFGMLRAMTKAVALTPGTMNVGMWYQIENPAWMLAWNKPACMGNSPFGVCNFEPILFWGKARRNSGCDVITAPVVPDKSVQGHPCPKPVMWAKKLSVLMAEQNETVIDPFCGSGTTLLAAKQLNRRAIGIECDERFCEMAVNRLAQGVLL
jgi:site-specific DNA-methyltransferase (adenine-specific)